MLVLVGSLAGGCVLFQGARLTGEARAGLLSRGGWPPALLLWTTVISNAWVPVQYAIFTPKRPERGTLLERGVDLAGFNAAYPKQAATDMNGRKVKEWQLMFVIAYTILAVVVMGM